VKATIRRVRSILRRWADAVTSDDLALSIQRSMDRLVRRLRRGAAPKRTERRLLIVQIDGLSRIVLEQALASGRMPFLKQLLRRQGYQLEPMTVGLPTSTPAFQMAAFYGVRPDIPGFHYFDRDRQSDIHFPRRGHAAMVEEQQAAGRLGILDGGSVYGCVFTGGAGNNVFTFAGLMRPGGPGLLAALSPFVIFGWVCLKGAVQTIIEVVKTMPLFAGHPVRRRQGWRWLRIKIICGVWMRELFTMAVSRDLYAGVPAVYVNYIDYDEAAHNFGPRSRQAFMMLRRIDRAIRQLGRVLRRVPEQQYDLYILSDHGQTFCTSYDDLTGGQRFERWIFDEFLAPSQAGTPDPPAELGLARGIRERRAGSKELFQHFLNYLDEDFLRHPDPEAHEANGVRVISAGPNAFLYVLREKEPLDADALEHRFPGLAEKLSKSPGVGFVLARSKQGAVCFWNGQRYHCVESGAGPFASRQDASVVLQGIGDLMKMKNAGDYVIYGIDLAADGGHVSFIPERGAHAGPSATELHTFIVRPGRVTLPSPISHPVQLYGHFIRYQQAS
jgi:hypothetical protein